MRYITLVEVREPDAEEHKASWMKFGDVISAERAPDGKLADALNRLAAPIAGPAWVALAELNEEFKGDAERAHAELELFVDRLMKPQAQLSASARFVGADYANVRAYRPKLWYVPAGSTFGAEWEFRFELDVVVTSKRPTFDSLLFGVNPEFFAITRRTPIRGFTEVQRRRAIIEAVLEPLSEAERQHYAEAALPEWSPLLSLCVIARGVDANLLRMLASARGHFSEVVLLLTRFAVEEDVGLEGLVREALVGVVDVPLVLDSWRDPDSFQLEDGTWCIANFDRARQRCFDLAHGMFRMFLDSDDTLEWTLGEPAPQLWDIVQKNFMGDTSVAFPYLYVPESPLGDDAAPGLSQPRNALFRWEDDAGQPLWRWHRPLHERAVPTAWNAAAKHKNLCLDAGFFIKHHGSADAAAHRERNKHIALHGLANRHDLAPIDCAALEYVLATIALDEDGLEAAEPLYRQAMEHGGGDSYGLVATTDLASALVAAHRGVEVPPLLLPLLEGSPGDPSLQLALARAYRAVGQPYLALKWYWEVFKEKPEPPAGAEYRNIYADAQYNGRLEAVEVALEVKSLDVAEKVLVSAPPAVLNRHEVQEIIADVRRRNGDFTAAQAALTLTHYLLSLDCVDLAAGVVESLSPQLMAQPHGVRARRMVERRQRHLRDDGAYLATYDVLNEADLVVKAKRHQPFLLERIIAAAPDTFIDVGCNTAWLTINVAKALPACHCIGIDISKARVEEARRRAALEGVENIEFFVSSAELDSDTFVRMDLPHKGHTLVLISEVLEHLEEPGDVLEFWAQAGHIMITVPDVEAYFNLWPWARQLDTPLAKSERLGSEGAEHVRCYDAHRLVEELHEAGFEPQRIERIDISTNLAGEGENDRSLLFADAKICDPHMQMVRLGRIDIHCEGWVPWGPRAHLEGSGEKSRMVGGSEQAVIHLAPELAALGYEVHVYACPMDRREYERGVWWHPLGEFQASEPRDLVIVWRRAEHLLLCSKESAGRWPVWLWCHDVPDPKRTGDYCIAEKVLVLSDYQRGLFREVGVPAEKLVVLQNGVDAGSVQLALNCTDVADNLRDPHAVFYGSSGDRGLLHLLRMWPGVREAVPDARLICTYRTDLMRWPTNGPTWFEIADEIEKLGATLPGVTFYPGLPHDEYLAAAARCGVWAYPSNFEEISCIVAMEMQALGLEPVTTDLAALRETVLEGPLVSWEVVRRELMEGGAEARDGTFWVPEGCFSKTFRDILVGALERSMVDADRGKLSHEALTRYSWTRTARLFAAAIEESKNEPQSHEEPR